MLVIIMTGEFSLLLITDEISSPLNFFIPKSSITTLGLYIFIFSSASSGETAQIILFKFIWTLKYSIAMAKNSLSLSIINIYPDSISSPVLNVNGNLFLISLYINQGKPDII